MRAQAEALREPKGACGGFTASAYAATKRSEANTLTGTVWSLCSFHLGGDKCSESITFTGHKSCCPICSVFLTFMK